MTAKEAKNLTTKSIPDIVKEHVNLIYGYVEKSARRGENFIDCSIPNNTVLKKPIVEKIKEQGFSVYIYDVGNRIRVTW